MPFFVAIGSTGVASEEEARLGAKRRCSPFSLWFSLQCFNSDATEPKISGLLFSGVVIFHGSNLNY